MSRRRTRAQSSPGPKLRPALRVAAHVAAEVKEGFNPFTPLKPPPNVFPDGLVMDGCIDTASWGNAALSGSYFADYAEGMVFLGFPMLSEMAQRPEYRMVVETLATEMTRKWIKITSNAKGDQAEKIEQIEAEFERLKVRDVFEQAARHDGFYGRSHIYLDLGAKGDELAHGIGDGTGERSAQKVGKGCLKAIRAVEPVWCWPKVDNTSRPFEADFFRPDHWYSMSTQIHRTRLIPMVSREVPDMLKGAYAFGGLPLTQMLKPYVDNWLRTRQSVSDLISQFTVSVLKTDTTGAFFDGSGNGMPALVARAKAFTQFRDNRGVYVIDKEQEDFTNVSAPLGTLDVLQLQALEFIAFVSGIPLVILLGKSPSGLNASADGEFRAFYDRIAAQQKAFFAEPLMHVLRIIQLSMFGKVDESIGFEFCPLYELSEKERAEIRKIDADTDAVLIDAGVISAEESRARVADDPASPYDGLSEELPDPVLGEGGTPFLDSIMGSNASV